LKMWSGWVLWPGLTFGEGFRWRGYTVKET
jgi:hypothetical protein